MGHVEIWGATIPARLKVAVSNLLSVKEGPPVTGFKLEDRAVFGLTVKISEELKGNMSESVRFKNDAMFGPWQP